MKKLVAYFTENQKRLLLIDSAGALMTALFLGVIGREFNTYVGMPKEVITYLAVIAVCFCVYSATCYFFLKEGFLPFIRFIAFANLLYCALTIALLIKYQSSLTMIGTTYFLIEIPIICGLSYIEFNAVKK